MKQKLINFLKPIFQSIFDSIIEDYGISADIEDKLDIIEKEIENLHSDIEPIDSHDLGRVIEEKLEDLPFSDIQDEFNELSQKYDDLNDKLNLVLKIVVLGPNILSEEKLEEIKES